MTNLDSVLKSRDITLPIKVCLVKAMVFPVVMYGCENWTIKKAEHWRTDAFELWCWRRLLRVPRTARRSNHSILKEISPEYSLEGLMLKLKLQYFGHLMRRAESFEKILQLGKIEGRRRRGWQRMRWLDGITDSMDMSLSRLWESVVMHRGRLMCYSPWGLKDSDMTEWLNWTEHGPAVTCSPGTWAPRPDALGQLCGLHGLTDVECTCFYHLHFLDCGCEISHGEQGCRINVRLVSQSWGADKETPETFVVVVFN